MQAITCVIHFHLITLKSLKHLGKPLPNVQFCFAEAPGKRLKVTKRKILTMDILQGFSEFQIMHTNKTFMKNKYIQHKCALTRLVKSRLYRMWWSLHLSRNTMSSHITKILFSTVLAYRGILLRCNRVLFYCPPMTLCSTFMENKRTLCVYLIPGTMELSFSICWWTVKYLLKYPANKQRSVTM